LLLACSLTAPAQTSRQADRPLTIDDLLALRNVSDPRMSPDGAWIAYVVEHVDTTKDELVMTVHVVSSDGRETRPMTVADRSATTPRWSPDGRYLAFLATKIGEAEAKPQVWTLDLRGGEAQQWTYVEQGVSDFGWAPSGERMWLLIKDMSPEEREAQRAAEAKEEPRPQPVVIDRLEFKSDGVGYLDRSRTHLYVVDRRGAEPRQLTFGDYDDGEPAWSPDGRYIAFVSNRTEEPDSNDNTDIWIVPADGERAEPRRVTTNPGPDWSPAWSHDGERIAYVTAIEPDLIWYATNHLAVISARGGEPELPLRALDRNVREPVFAPKDDAVVFRLEDSAEEQLARLDLRSGRLERLVAGDLAVYGFDLHRSGRAALLVSTPHRPPEVFLWDGRRHRQLTRTNEGVLNAVRLGEVRNVTFASRDGTEIEGFIVTPPDYQPGRRYPTLLRIHGGPVSQYDFSFNDEAQLFAAHGYVVVLVNPRGSSGYGQEFSAAIWADWGNKDFQDVLAGVDYAIEQGYAHPDRLGVGGWSYGGILTNYVITKSQRFKGAISGASEVLYVANYGHDHYQHEWETELGLPWEDREAWERITPFNDVDKVTTPTLVIGGKDDWNVPILNSEQLYQALKRRGIDTQLVVYPGQTHSITRPSFIRDRYERYLDWYDRTVRGDD
jgi:dipeptidyl aminopeptidase/acylaminoacyl peptidase